MCRGERAVQFASRGLTFFTYRIFIVLSLHLSRLRILSEYFLRYLGLYGLYNFCLLYTSPSPRDS